MDNYVQQQNAGRIIINAIKIYRENFLLILLAFLPTLPFAIFNDVALGYKAPDWVATLLTGLDYFVSLLVVLLVMTVIISDICVGNRPSLSRSFKRLRVITLYKFLLTYLWAVPLIFLSFSPQVYDLAVTAVSPFVVIPVLAVVVLCSYAAMMFFPSVVVLQNKWGVEAIKRSARLGWGRYLRNVSIVIGVYLIYYVIYVLLSLLVKNFLLTTIITHLVGLLIKPFAVICVVIMYYDMRKRKNPLFDTAMLAAEVGPAS